MHEIDNTLSFNVREVNFNLYILETSLGSTSVGELYLMKHQLTMELFNFEIYERYRGFGIGRTMIRYVKEHYPRYDITLGVVKENEIAMNLYKSEGFEIIEDCGYYYKMTCKCKNTA